MAIKFGSTTGRRERVNYRPNEGELDCGNNIYVYLRNIQKSESFEDEQFSCSVGIICGQQGEYPEWCPQNITLRITEEYNPKYEPREEFKEAELEVVVTKSEEGEAALTLACPVKPRRVSFELTADIRGDQIPSAEEILNCATADGAQSLVGHNGIIPIDIPVGAKWVKTDKSIEKPVDDFWTTTVTYTWRLPYPDEDTRKSYILPALEALGLESKIEEVLEKATIEIEGTLRQGDTPMRRVTINWQAVESIEE